MKFYNVLFLGICSSVSLLSMEDNSDKFKVIQEGVRGQLQSLSFEEGSNLDPQDLEAKQKLQDFDGKVNVFQKIRQEKVKELADLFEAARENARQVRERRQKESNDKPKSMLQEGEVSEDDENYDDFEWKMYELDELGKKKQNN